MEQRTQYTEAYKKDAVRLMLARGSRTLADVAEGLGVSKSMLYRWHERYGSEVNGGTVVAQHEREEVERLRRRLRELELENSLLKKAAALFAREVK